MTKDPSQDEEKVRLTIFLEPNSPEVIALQEDAKNHGYRYAAGYAGEIIKGFYELQGDDPRESRIFPEIYKFLKPFFQQNIVGQQEKKEEEERKRIPDESLGSFDNLTESERSLQDFV